MSFITCTSKNRGVGQVCFDPKTIVKVEQLLGRDYTSRGCRLYFEDGTYHLVSNSFEAVFKELNDD